MNDLMEMLAVAIAFAAQKHKGQVDRAGLPYILHPLKVMYFLKSDDPELMAIAVLHDVIEDTNAKYMELNNLGMTIRVIDGVEAMTKRNGEVHDDYMKRVKANPDAVKVKLADLRHNSDIRRLKGITDKDVARMRKYHSMYMELKDL